jgi:hypothetical protein
MHAIGASGLMQALRVSVDVGRQCRHHASWVDGGMLHVDLPPLPQAAWPTANYDVER